MSAQRCEDVVVEWDNGVGAPDEEGSDGEIERHGYAEDALLEDRGLSVGVDYVDGRAVEGLKKGCEGGMGGGKRRRDRLFGRLRRRFLRRFLLCLGWHLGALGEMLCANCCMTWMLMFAVFGKASVEDGPRTRREHASRCFHHGLGIISSVSNARAFPRRVDACCSGRG